MEKTIYLFMRSIKLQNFSLKENERSFVLYALAQSSIRRDEIICRVPIRDAFYFLCNGEEDIDKLKEKTEELFKAFTVRLKNKKRVIQTQLLNRITARVEQSKLILVFNAELVREWWESKEIANNKLLEEFAKEDIEKVLEE